MALVLSRKENEGITITIPPSDKERVIHLQPSQLEGVVRLAFTADESIIISRDELIDNDEGD